METPCYLTGLFKESFAYLTITHRLPEIITNLVDILARNNGFKENEELRIIINKLTELRYNVLTNKKITSLLSNHPENIIWNQLTDSLKSENIDIDQNPTWLSVSFLFAECIFYRKIFDIFFDVYKDSWQDYFFDIKIKSITNSIKLWKEMIYFSEKTHTNSQDIFKKDTLFAYFQACLWGNQWDLSLSAGQPIEQTSCVSNFIPQSDSNHNSDQIWCGVDFLFKNDFDEIFPIIESLKINENGLKNSVIDILLDNVGFELFSDINLSMYLIECSVCQKVILHFKNIPWFVSDALVNDVKIMIEYFKETKDPIILKWCHRFESMVNDGLIIFETSNYWTCPLGFHNMSSDVSFNGKLLFEKLNQSSLIIFKGDLNYRKIVDDRQWPIDCPLNMAVRQFFNPKCPIVLLRVLKSEVCVAIDTSTKEKLQAQDKSWMVNGKYALIQLSKN